MVREAMVLKVYHPGIRTTEQLCMAATLIFFLGVDCLLGPWALNPWGFWSVGFGSVGFGSVYIGHG